MHVSVMLPEVLESLSPVDGGVYVDGTFGAGGYSRAILDAAECTVIAIDRDPSVQKIANDMHKEYGARFVFIRGAFGDVARLLAENGFEKVDGFVLDIGVSSMQLDQAERGFSFQREAELDMRMDSEQDLTAADIVNSYNETDLANLIYKYGEERKSRRIAKCIVQARPVGTTKELAEIVKGAIGGYSKTHPATRTFQALRIAVNDELGQLEQALESSVEILKPDGKLVVVTFHSLEDRIVKNFMNEQAGRIDRGSRYMPEITSDVAVSFALPKKPMLKPSDEEISVNPRSRSAKLRRAVRV